MVTELRRFPHGSDRERGVLFDYDDTLVASVGQRREAMVRTIRALGREPDLAGFDHAYGLKFRQLAAAVDPNGDFDVFLEKYLMAVRDAPAPLLRGARELVFALEAKGVRLAIITSSDSRLVKAELISHGLARQLSFVLGTEAPGPHKPEPEALHYACHRLGVPFEKTSYVGDSLSDLQMALQAEMDFVAVCTGQTNRETFVAAGLAPRQVVESLVQASSLLL